jgi:hypothetical protein
MVFTPLACVMELNAVTCQREQVWRVLALQECCPVPLRSSTFVSLFPESNVCLRLRHCLLFAVEPCGERNLSCLAFDEYTRGITITTIGLYESFACADEGCWRGRCASDTDVCVCKVWYRGISAISKIATEAHLWFHRHRLHVN